MCQVCQERASEILGSIPESKLAIVLENQEDLEAVIGAITYSLVEEGVRLNQADLNAIAGSMRLAFMVGYEYATEIWKDY